ncbi:hypothetical protein ACFY93_33630 [Streptomyces sp. NPDC008313]|uniref:hypothetical protein n=1 Tax=Streptomyces sp. NPDC008313 TaxID=3364826 RepID=UPI0036EFBD57
MRSARILLATATATAALAIAAPGAYALSAGDWDHDDSSYSQEHSQDNGGDHEKSDSHGRPHGGMHTGGGALATVGGDDWTKDDSGDAAKDDQAKEESGKDSTGKPDWKHDKPEGGMHTGGGALSAVSGDDWSKDNSGDTEKGYGSGGYEKDSSGKPDWKHDKPEGGMHTGGGGLATSDGGLAGGAVLLLGGLGAGAYMLRRRSGLNGAGA